MVKIPFCLSFLKKFICTASLRTPDNDDFIGCCTSPVYLILGSIWDPLLPDPAFDRHFPSYWMDRLKTSMIAKSGKKTHNAMRLRINKTSLSLKMLLNT